MIQFVAILVFILCIWISPGPHKGSYADLEAQRTSAVAAPVESKTYGPDGCSVDVASHLRSEHQVGQIINLEEERFEFGYKNECTVHYDITVDGVEHHVDQTETSLEQMNSVCYYAKERGRKNLLLDLPGKFDSHANIDCRYTDTIGKESN